MSILTSRTTLGTRVKGIEARERISAYSTARSRLTPSILPIVREPQAIPVPGISRSIEVKFASTESEWEQAFELAAANYQARGYETPGVNRLRFTPYHALPDTFTLVAKDKSKVVATFSIVIDNSMMGLPMEDIYPNEIGGLREKGHRLLETTTLADSNLSVREFIQVFITLIKLGMQYHTSLGGDTYVIAVNPRHRSFYTKILGFMSLGPRRSYNAVQDAPAEAFWVDNASLKTNVPNMYENLFGASLARDVLSAPRLPCSLVRRFGEESTLCDQAEIDKILSVRDQSNSLRPW